MAEFPIGASATLADLTADPHPLLARLRAAEPVSWLPVLGGWLVTDHTLAQQVMRDATVFTVDDPRFSTARVIGPSMLSLDGAEHARHRDPFVPPFRPAAVRDRFTAFVTAEADRLIATLTSGHAELRGDFAGPLAVAVVAEALGLTDVDATTVRSWYALIVDSVSEVTAGRPATEDGAAAFRDLGNSIAVMGEYGLDPGEFVSNAAVLMFGGIDTTEAMIVNLVLHLLSRPRVLAEVRAEPALLAAAVAESVRLEPAAAVVDRYATRDVSLGGADIAAGDLVTVSITGANRDPAVFTDPDTFDLRRHNVQANLAFALGPHFCLGARLARAEAEIAVSALLASFPNLRLTADIAPTGLVFRKPTELPVRWD